MQEDALAANLASVSARVARAAERVGRNPASVSLVAVSKTVSPGVLAQAYVLGVRDFGENRVQEAAHKLAAVVAAPEACPLLAADWSRPPGQREARLHLLGTLQTNKAKLAMRLFDSVHSVDRWLIAEELSKQAEEAGRLLPVLLEVNISREASKHGFSAEELVGLLPELMALPGLDIRGLMTIAPYVADSEETRPIFRDLHQLRDRLRSLAPEASLPELSMGMSDDFEVAVEEGATIIRIGRALFGPRAR